MSGPASSVAGRAASNGRDLVSAVRRRLDRARIADSTMLVLAGVVGIVTGAMAAAMIGAIHLVQEVAFGGEASALEVLLVPAAGGVLVWGASRLATEVTGGGVVTAMESLVLRGGRLRARIPFVQTLATAFALGTGHAGGREGPIVLVGGAVGSTVGQRFRLGEDEIRSLVAAGAAAGIGAAFNAPIGGMLFAIEVIVGGLRSRSLQVIVVGSVAGSVVARLLVGEDLIYKPVQVYRLSDPRELALYVLVGVVCAVLAAAMIRGEQLGDRLFAPVRRVGGDLLALVVGGLVVGAVALVVPAVLGDGEQLPRVAGVLPPMQALIDGAAGVGWAAVGGLALLLAGKFVATMASLSSRSAVGSFAPTLFLGAVAGTLVATIATTLLGQVGASDLGIEPGAYALVGMAAAYGAAARAPLTAVLIVFELSGEYDLMLPLMLAVGVATFLADRTTPGSLYTVPLRERGIVYAQPDDVDLLQTVTVEEVMTTGHPTVRPSMTLAELERRFDEELTHGFAVVSGGVLQGVVTIGDLARAEPLLASGLRPASSVMVQDLMTTDVLTVSPTDEVFHALRLMASIDVGRVPVTTSGHTYLGMLRRGDVVDAYRTALQRGVDRQHGEGQAALRDLTGVRFLELRVARGSAADGRTIADVPWPTSAVVTSIRRGLEVLVPKGATVLRADDEVVLLATHEDVERARRLLERPREDL